MALTPWECKSVGVPRCRNAPAPDRRARPYPSVVAELHDATEEYLETILEIEEEGIPPIRARLVERLGISAPAVSETVNRLVEQGYAELLENRSLRLTPRGGRAPWRSFAATAWPSGASPT